MEHGKRSENGLKMTYLAHLLSLSYWVQIRPKFRALIMVEQHSAGNFAS